MTMNNTEIKERIRKILGSGQNNAKTADEVVKELNLPFDRSNVTIRTIIKEMRMEGALIGSSNKGFFLIQAPEDLDVTIDHLNSRTREINNIIEVLTDSFRQIST